MLDHGESWASETNADSAGGGGGGAVYGTNLHLSIQRVVGLSCYSKTNCYSIRMEGGKFEAERTET